MTLRSSASIVLLAIVALARQSATAQVTETVEDDRLTWENSDQGDQGEADHPTRSSSEDEALSAAVSKIVQQTNEYRRSHQLPPVERDAQLQKTAGDFARYMARTNRYGHRADGQTPAERASNHGYKYCQVAENIAYYYDSRKVDAAALADEFMTGWIESKGHRENLLRESTTQTGVAVAQDEKTGYYFAVQMFGRPRSAAVEFSIANRTEHEVGYVVSGGQTERSFTLPPRAVMTHTRCLPPQIQLQQEGAKPVPVSAGERFTIVREDDQLLLKKGSDKAPVVAP